MRVFARFCGVVCVVLGFVVNLLLPETQSRRQGRMEKRHADSHLCSKLIPSDKLEAMSFYADGGPLRPSLAIHARLQESRLCGILVASARLEQCNRPEVQLEV